MGGAQSRQLLTLTSCVNKKRTLINRLPVSQGLRSFVQQHEITVIGEHAVAAAACAFFGDPQVYQFFDPFGCGGERETCPPADVVDRCDGTIESISHSQNGNGRSLGITRSTNSSAVDHGGHSEGTGTG